jgi:hypothetical protein
LILVIVVVVSIRASVKWDLAPVMAGEEANAAPDLTVGLRALGVLAPLFVIALTVYIVRIWTRSRPKYRLNASDYTISVAMASIYPPPPPLTQLRERRF